MMKSPQPAPAPPPPPAPIRIPSPADPDIAAQNRARTLDVFASRRGRNATRLTGSEDGGAYTRTTLG